MEHLLGHIAHLDSLRQCLQLEFVGLKSVTPSSQRANQLATRPSTKKYHVDMGTSILERAAPQRTLVALWNTVPHQRAASPHSVDIGAYSTARDTRRAASAHTACGGALSGKPKKSPRSILVPDRRPVFPSRQADLSLLSTLSMRTESDKFATHSYQKLILFAFTVVSSSAKSYETFTDSSNFKCIPVHRIYVLDSSDT